MNWEKLLFIAVLLVLSGCASQSEQANLVKVVDTGDSSLGGCTRIQDVNAQRNAWSFGMGYFSARKQVVYDLQERAKVAGGDTLAVTDQSYVPFSGITKASGIAYRCQSQSLAKAN